MRSRAIVLSLSLLALCGCVQNQYIGEHQIEAADTAGLETRADVVRRFGIPTRVLQQPNDGVVYRYENAPSKGMFAGFVQYGARFGISHHWRNDDILEFHFDGRDRLVEARDAAPFDGAGYALWPFGK